MKKLFLLFLSILSFPFIFIIALSLFFHLGILDLIIKLPGYEEIAKMFDKYPFIAETEKPYETAFRMYLAENMETYLQRAQERGIKEAFTNIRTVEKAQIEQGKSAEETERTSAHAGQPEERGQDRDQRGHLWTDRGHQRKRTDAYRKSS